MAESREDAIRWMVALAENMRDMADEKDDFETRMELSRIQGLGAMALALIYVGDAISGKGNQDG